MTHEPLEVETPPPQRTGEGRKLNVGCGRDVRPPAEGWVNMDAFLEAPDILKWDMTRTPWPFADGEFDVVLCSHVLEHVPLVYEEHDGVKRDVLFAVMEEIHRVLKPGGVLHLKAPWGGSHLGRVHPQHYRQWRPDWFAYFSPDFPENYYSTARFRVRTWRRNPFGSRWPYVLPLGKSRLGVFQHLSVRIPPLRPLLRARHELEAWLEAVK